jgi:hypothetical protein
VSTIDYMFSGADASGRDDLIPRRSRQPAPRENGFLTRTAATVTLALASICSVPGDALAFSGRVDVAETTQVPLDERMIDDDPTMERVWSVTSEGEQPSEESRSTATTIVDLLRDQTLEPDRVLADPEGGVALYVFGEGMHPGGAHARYARIVATNAGEVGVLLVNRGGGEPSSWDVHERDRASTIQRVRDFLVKR